MEKKKFIKVEIENKQLDALEDLLTAELSIEEKRKAQAISLKLWENLVSAYKDSVDFEDQHTISPMGLYVALEGIMKYDESFYDPKSKMLQVQNSDDYNEKIKLIPENVVAIIPHPEFPKSRRKAIYVKDETKNGLVIKTYFLNNNEFTFPKLCAYLDPLNHYLLNVSKNAIINVDCYDLSKSTILKLNLNKLKVEHINLIKASNELPFNTKHNFPIIKNGIKKRLSLQKFVIGYKNDFNL